MRTGPLNYVRGNPRFWFTTTIAARHELSLALKLSMRTKKRIARFNTVQAEIGLAIAQLRIEAGYETTKEFTSRFDLPEIQYWRIENGKANLTLKSIYRILEVHNVDFFEFFHSIKVKAVQER